MITWVLIEISESTRLNLLEDQLAIKGRELHAHEQQKEELLSRLKSAEELAESFSNQVKGLEAMKKELMRQNVSSALIWK